jgi:uncharacterized repeat protein (TIGR03843 family)
MVSAKQLRPESILAQIKTVRQLQQANNGQSSLIATEVEPDLTALLKNEMELEGLMPWSSNYTFLVTLSKVKNQTKLMAIYKPCQGERPLWDFPSGNLCYREFASYLVSQALGWPRIPSTVLREGPHGPGSVQLFVDAEYEAHYFNLRHISALIEDFRRVAIFDYIINNADRKGGHCLKGKDGQIWAIDHGLTFHTDFKLRTVIWEFCEEAIPACLLEDLERLHNQLGDSSELCRILSFFINLKEIQAFKRRIDRLIAAGHLPELHSSRNIPFPPV